MKEKLTKTDMENYLFQINEKLARDDKHGQILMVGGAVMTMVFGARDATHDIDAIFQPKENLRGVIKEIAIDNNIREDWLNDAMKAYLTPQMGSTVFKEYSNLTVSRLNTDCILAMKLIAARDERDLKDALFLMKNLKIKNVEELYDLVEKYTEKNYQTPKSYYFIQEVYEVYRREICKETQEKLPSVIVKKQNDKTLNKPSLLNRVNAEKKNIEEYKKAKDKSLIINKKDIEI